MAKLTGGGDSKVTYYAIGALIALAILVYAGAYFFGGGQSAPPVDAKANGAKASSLGSTAEGGVVYNQTFQERMLKTINQSMEQMRSENTISMENFRREQVARDAERDARVQEDLTQSRETQQTQADPRMDTQVEPVKIHAGTGGADRRAAVDDGGFLGTPADVKDPALDQLQSPTPNGAKKDVLGLVVPPNGFIKGRTLNGVVAVVNAAAKPFLVKLQGQYRSANGYVMNLDSCTAYVEGRADLSAGRILGKPAKLTCNFSGRGSKTWDVSGYIVDQDGIEGIVGVINDNGGKKLAGAALGGGIALAGARLSAAQTQTYTGAGGTSSAVTGSISSDLAGGLAQGAGTELSRQVIDHYNQYQASVQVGGNKEITLVLLNELAVPDSGKEITPTHSTSTSKGTP